MSDPSIKPDTSPAIKKSHPLNYAPPLTAIERLTRHFPSGGQFVNFLKNLVWVIPLTLLIWVYAEREQTVTLSTEPISIDVRTNAHDRIVNLRLPRDKNIIVELSGPRAQIDRVRELLRPRPGPNSEAAVQIYVDPQIDTGPQQLLTVSQINNLPVFKNNGITVKSAQPPYLSVDIDVFETRNVPVRPPPEIAGMLSDQTRFVPDVVEIRAPKLDLEKADAEGALFVYANLPKRDELKVKTGLYSVENVPVYWPRQRENVSLTPLTVSARLDIKQRDAEYTIPSVPIVKQSTADFDQHYVLVFTGGSTIPNGAVTGPLEQIELIKKGELKVKARLDISDLLDYTVGAQDRRPLQWDLPPGVALTKETKDRAANWAFTILDRDR
jgi:hypothetical protein